MIATARIAVLYALASACAAVPARAVDAPPLRGSAPTDAEAAKAAREDELAAITRDIAVTQERQEALAREIDALEKDRATLNSSLIETGERAKALEAKIDEAERRMGALLDEETKLRGSLDKRRAVLADVLAALQRMGRKPPPAVVVRPEDALAAVRSAMLLGAVVPGLRRDADGLSHDLAALVSLKQEQGRERDRMRADATALAEERTRIGLLVEEKRRAQAATAEQLDAEKRKSEALADKAKSLGELIASLESDIESAREAAEAARRAEEANRAAEAAGTAPQQPSSLGAADRIVPAVTFAKAKGLLPRPVNGVEIRSYGEPDGLGGTTAGLSIATRSGARVASPTDGWVVYAGPFRSYGNLLIINAGGGYHVLLAGMERIDPQVGQFVLAGEPVAVMGTRLLACAGGSGPGGARLGAAGLGAAGLGATQPVLYVEFRKDGTSIDPAPWWAKPDDEKVGG